MSGKYDGEKRTIEQKISRHRDELRHVEAELNRAKDKVREEEKGVIEHTNKVNKIMMEIHDEEKRLMDIQAKEAQELRNTHKH